MELKKVIQKIRDIAEAYYAIPQGYDDKEQLQEWKQHLTYFSFYLADNFAKKISKQKVYLEGQKAVVRLDAYNRLKAEDSASGSKKTSDTALLKMADGSFEYAEWLSKNADAYGSYTAFKMYSDAVQNLIYSIGSHQGMIKKTDKHDL